MPTKAELKQIENDAIRKARSSYKEGIKKMQDTQLKRLSNFLEPTDFFEHKFSDSELLSLLPHFKKLIESKKPKHSLNQPSTNASVTN